VLGGIPGTGGGAIKMNAGSASLEIGGFVRRVDGIFPDGTPYRADGKSIEWRYREATIPERVIVTQVEFELTPSSPEAESKIIAGELARRKEHEPAGRTAGCVFRNISDLDPAGKLIDECGLKNCRIGDVVVSDKHANFLINVGEATEADFGTLCCLLRHAVAEKFGYFLTFENKMLNGDLARRLASSPPAPRVNVLCGGNTSERSVSLNSGKAVATALHNAGFEVELTDLKRCTVTRSMRKADAVYPVLHGGFGEGGELQAKLEREKLRFCCSGSAASELVMDKIATKRLLDRLGIPTAKWCIITRSGMSSPGSLHYPVVVKVPREGSTVGIVKINSADEWEAAVRKEFELADELLVEEFIEGVEITIPVLFGKALDAIEIRSPHGFYDYDAKYIYKDGHTQYFCPPVSLKEPEIERAKKLATLFYHAAGCRDLLRVDFIISKDNVPMVLEGNSLPGCTATSLVPKAARAAGMSLEKMTSLLVYSAMKRPVLADRDGAIRIRRKPAAAK
ncbi:MAG: D-alanine--D-alanine ligase, partial [Victivallaceae bacterium]|nr:D-alanine--D-alanine ligase [Victivallaceae bacterium]